MFRGIPAVQSLAKPLLLATAILATACGGGGGSPTGSNAPPDSDAFVINVVGQAGSQSFDPSPASAGGRSVVFRNVDSVVHRVVLNDGSIDTGDIAAGASSRIVRMPMAGTNYHCAIHPTMTGRVNADGGAPPPCTGIYCN